MWGAAFTPDGRGLVSGSSDKTLKHWGVSRSANGPGDQQNPRGVESNGVCTMNFIGHKVRVELADWGCV